MPILRLNATEEDLQLQGSAASASWATRSAARGNGPVIIMVHGFKYDPWHPAHNPHSSIFAAATHAQCPADVHWPRHLGFGLGDPDEGLAIAFAWRARGNIWRAKRTATSAGRHLARAIRHVRSVAPRRPIHIVSHSMGSEVAFEAIEALPAGSIQRMISLTGASYQSRAEAALRSPCGRTVELFNVVSRENDLFDFCFERLIAPEGPNDNAMSAGLSAPNALTLQLDCPTSLDALKRFGGYLAQPQRRVCHWSGYTRPGALRFYKQLLRQPETIAFDAIKQALPRETSARWSRIMPRPDFSWPVTDFRKTVS